ncbi:MAG TPA: hypothetical protein VGO15_03065 [Candidatus Limnocylindrales bacterium]|jgi:hypothetical protein|nr:hypothetical protein [Candidatus Limnocylindrales bacterium]
MDFVKRAREAAEAAAEQGRQAANVAVRTVHDPSTQERIGHQAQQALGAAKRGVSTVIEKIDPGTLAELIIKATALQEMTNTSLRQKGSPYRINEIAIAASIPPGVTFAIGRIDIQEEAVTTVAGVSSAELVDALPDSGEAVISLDGTTVPSEEVAQVGAGIATEVAEISRP